MAEYYNVCSLITPRRMPAVSLNVYLVFVSALLTRDSLSKPQHLENSCCGYYGLI
jgi:hypothetical protein